MGSVAKSYMRKGFLIYDEMRKYLTMHMRRPLLVKYDFATDLFWILLYMMKIFFSFLSVCRKQIKILSKSACDRWDGAWSRQGTLNRWRSS